MDNLGKSLVEYSKAENSAKNVDWLKSVAAQLSDSLSSDDAVDLLNILLTKLRRKAPAFRHGDISRINFLFSDILI